VSWALEEKTRGKPVGVKEDDKNRWSGEVGRKEIGGRKNPVYSFLSRRDSPTRFPPRRNRPLTTNLACAMEKVLDVSKP
jgi:hypothetical protein